MVYVHLSTREVHRDQWARGLEQDISRALIAAECKEIRKNKAGKCSRNAKYARIS